MCRQPMCTDCRLIGCVLAATAQWGGTTPRMLDTSVWGLRSPAWLRAPLVDDLGKARNGLLKAFDVFALEQRRGSNVCRNGPVQVDRTA